MHSKPVAFEGAWPFIGIPPPLVTPHTTSTTMPHMPHGMHAGWVLCSFEADEEADEKRPKSMPGAALWLLRHQGTSSATATCIFSRCVSLCTVCFTEHNLPMDDLRKLVTPYYPDIMSRSNKSFWQRKVGREAAGRAGPPQWSGRLKQGGGRGREGSQFESLPELLVGWVAGMCMMVCCWMGQGGMVCLPLLACVHGVRTPRRRCRVLKGGHGSVGVNCLVFAAYCA